MLFRSFQDVRSVLTQHTLDYLVIAKDIVHEDIVTLQATVDLEKAWEIFAARDFKLIPVVEGDRVKGVLRREDLVEYYNKRLIERLRR